MICDCKSNFYYCNLLHTCNLPLKQNKNSSLVWLPRGECSVCQVLCVIKQREGESREEDETEDMNRRWRQLIVETKGCSLRASVAEESRLIPDVKYQGGSCIKCTFGLFARPSAVWSEESKRPLRALLPRWFFSPALREMDDNGSDGGGEDHNTLSRRWVEAILLLQTTPLIFFGYDQGLWKTLYGYPFWLPV